jgi:hypothetical protein
MDLLCLWTSKTWDDHREIVVVSYVKCFIINGHVLLHPVSLPEWDNTWICMTLRPYKRFDLCQILVLRMADSWACMSRARSRGLASG